MGLPQVTVNDTDFYSPALIIRDGIIQRLQSLAVFGNVALWSKTRGRSPYQAQHIPLIAVYRLKETMVQEGDGNHADPRFKHSVVYGFSVVLQNNDVEQVERDLNRAHWAILRSLENRRWWRFDVVGEWQRNPFTHQIPPIKIEAVTRGEIKPINYGTKNTDGEMPFAEQEADYTITFETEFPPFIPDDLNLLHVTVAYPWPYDPNREQAFTAAWEVPTGAIPAPPVPPYDWGPRPLGLDQLGAKAYALGALDIATPVLTVIP